MSAPDNPRAFPSVAIAGACGGMTLRDWFAGQAPDPSEDDVVLQQKLDRSRNPHNDSYKPPLRSCEEIKAALRYRYADAMLVERAKGDAK